MFRYYGSVRNADLMRAEASPKSKSVQDDRKYARNKQMRRQHRVWVQDKRDPAVGRRDYWCSAYSRCIECDDFENISRVVYSGVIISFILLNEGKHPGGSFSITDHLIRRPLCLRRRIAADRCHSYFCHISRRVCLSCSDR